MEKNRNWHVKIGQFSSAYKYFKWKSDSNAESKTKTMHRQTI